MMFCVWWCVGGGGERGGTERLKSVSDRHIELSLFYTIDSELMHSCKLNGLRENHKTWICRK